MPRKSHRRVQREVFLAIGRMMLSRYNRLPNSNYSRTQLNALQFAFSIIVHGLSYMDTSLCFLENGIIPPSHSSYYILIDRVIDEIVKLSRENVYNELLSMKLNTVISMDGSWDHKRQGMCCIVVIIDQKRKKIVDFEILRRSTKNHPTDYKGSPQGMETEAVARISKRLKNDLRIVGYCHDRDSSVTSYMKKHWNIPEFIDRNHSVKCLATYFKDIEKKYGNQDELFTHLFNFLNFLISLPTTPEQKVAEWINASEHYRGNHTHCRKHKISNFVWKFSKSDQAIKDLKAFLKKTSFILIQCKPPFSTQLNECYNSIKSHFLNKEIAWRKTAFARLCCSIMEFNEVPEWRMRIRKSLNLPDLSPEVLARINEFKQMRYNFLRKRRTPEFQKDVRIKRFIQRNTTKKQDKSGYTGKPKNAY